MNADEWNRVQSLRTDGETIKGIARRLGMSRNTVRRALTLDVPPNDRRGARTTLYERHQQEIKRLISEDPAISAADLSATLGWEHAASTLAKYAARARAELAESGPFGSMEDRVQAPSESEADTSSAGSTHVLLPRYATTFIGRRAELARLRGLLGTHRLITLTGPGGIGKTRLATQLADQVRRAYPDGVRFIGLAGLASPELVSQAVLEGLRLAGRDQHGTTAEAALLNHLSDRRMLLVIDNSEHLVDACAKLVHNLLQGSTQLRILVTSREVLALSEEHVVPLSPLPICVDPETKRQAPDELATTPMDTAMALFESRAAAVLNGFMIDDDNRAAVRRVCKRLDGLPLAIELACARLSVLSVDDLAGRLDHSLDLLTTGSRAAPTRHQSLAATLAWSYDLCSEEQQILWQRASVFGGGFDLALAEEVCSDDTLPSSRILDAVMALVSKSILLREEHAGSVRFRMLETVREYGLSHLTVEEAHALHLNLLAWIHRRVGDLVASWAGADQVKINSWFRANRANLRSVLKWTLEDQDDADLRRTAAEVVAAPWFLWAGGFSVREHRLWLHRMAEVTDGTSRAQALAALALVQTLQGDREGAIASLEKAQSLAAQAGDEPTGDFVTHTRGLTAYFAGDFTAAEPLLLDALTRYEAREPRGGLRSALEVHLGMLYAFTDRIELSERHYSSVQQRALASGERWFRAYAEFGLGAIALARDDPDSAHSMALDGLALIADFDDEIGATLLLELLGWTEAAVGWAERATVLIGSASNRWAAFGRQLYGSGQWVDVRERYTLLARGRLGAERYAQLHAEGASMSTSEVISFALGDTPAPAPSPGKRAGEAQSIAGPAMITQLSRREREVADLVKQGMSNKDIAARLVLSHRTIEGHVEHVLQKLCLTSRTQIATYLPD